MTRPTRLSLLFVLAVIAGVISYFVTDLAYADLPTLPTYALLWLLLLTAVETYVALMTRARLHGHHGTRPIDPLAVARLVALAKATSLVGALALGVYAGFLTYVSQQTSTAAGHDTRIASFGVGFSLLLLAAAWFLERVCRVPPDRED